MQQLFINQIFDSWKENSWAIIANSWFVQS